ncbi:MAG TPA: DNA polymerase IV [Thermoleophilia bacterium]|nr:DNA polymerase IV [Thermoleophilia bacterium]
MFVSSPAIIHIDMDAFFASVEQARRPELRGRPVVVGGRAERRSVVSTSSYEARACGVRTAMPVAQARRLCPQAVFLPVDMSAYSAVHRKLLELFGRFTDLVEPVSIDEAVLDVAGSRRLFGPPRAIAGRIQELVYDEQGITCTLGLAPNKLLAKLAANLNKPAGIGVLTEADVHGRLRALPVGELYGVGPVTEERLHALGLTTVGMLQDVPLPFLAAAFGRSARPLKQLAFGRSASPVRPAVAAPSSMGHETTFAVDTAEPLALRAALLALADELMTRLRGHHYAARTVALKVRDGSFHTFERHLTLTRATTSTRTVYAAAAGLLDAVELGPRRIRLLGITVSGLVSGAYQLTFDDGWKDLALDEAVDTLRARYGRHVIRPAATCANGVSLC